MKSVSKRSAASDLEKNVRLAQKLARDLRSTQNARRAFDISRRLAEVSRQLEEATRVDDELDKHDRDIHAVG